MLLQKQKDQRRKSKHEERDQRLSDQLLLLLLGEAKEVQQVLQRHGIDPARRLHLHCRLRVECHAQPSHRHHLEVVCAVTDGDDLGRMSEARLEGRGWGERGYLVQRNPILLRNLLQQERLPVRMHDVPREPARELLPIVAHRQL